VNADLGRRHRIALVVNGRGRTGQIEDLVDFDIERESDVVANDLEQRVIAQVQDIVHRAGVVIIDTEHMVAAIEQPFAEVGPQKPGPAGHQHTLPGTSHVTTPPANDFSRLGVPPAMYESGSAGKMRSSEFSGSSDEISVKALVSL
jgi:hypothetical protein